MHFLHIAPSLLSLAQKQACDCYRRSRGAEKGDALVQGKEGEGRCDDWNQVEAAAYFYRSDNLASLAPNRKANAAGKDAQENQVDPI